MHHKLGIASLFALITLADEYEDSTDCIMFKSYVEASFDCTEDFTTCINAEEMDSDGTSASEKNVAKGGLLYNMNCSSMAKDDVWSNICELDKAWYPEDTDSGIYNIACKRENSGCDAILDLKPDVLLTYEWTISCSDGATRLFAFNVVLTITAIIHSCF